MLSLIDIIEEGDLCSAAIIVGVLLFVGSKVAANSRFRLLGRNIALGAFVLYFLGNMSVTSVVDGVDVVIVALRALALSGFVLGACWIALPIGSAVYDKTVGQTVRSARSWNSEQRSAKEKRRWKKEWERRQLESEEAYRREAPERERRARAEAERAALLLEHKKRREDARAACELLYNLHAAEIAERYPRNELDAFMAKYMRDDHPVEIVEERGRELRCLIERHQQKIEPTKKPRTLQDIAEWYLAEKARLESLPLDEEIRQMHLIALDERYADLSQELLQSMEP